MIDPHTQDRVLGVDAILSEVRQFRKLAPLGLSDGEIAHRMACTPLEVIQVRKLIGCKNKRLAEIPMPTRIRNLLRKNRIRTLDKLLSQSDKQLLAIRGLGAKTLKELKISICDFMEKQL